jgi:hypothetical protein
MRVYITKDHYDGSQSKTVEMDLDGAPMSQLVFMMMSAKVAGVTITKKFDVRKAVGKLNEEEKK